MTGFEEGGLKVFLIAALTAFERGGKAILLGRRLNYPLKDMHVRGPNFPRKTIRSTPLFPSAHQRRLCRAMVSTGRVLSIVSLVFALISQTVSLAAAPGDLLWSYALPTNTITLGPGFGQDGTAYALGGSAGEQLHLTAISTNGTTMWSTALGYAASRALLLGSASSFVIVAPDGDLVAGFGRQVSRVAGDGTFRWTRAFQQPLIGTPVIAVDGTVFLSLGSDAVNSQLVIQNSIVGIDRRGEVFLKRYGFSNNPMLDEYGMLILPSEGAWWKTDATDATSFPQGLVYSFGIFGTVHPLYIQASPGPGTVRAIDSDGSIAWSNEATDTFYPQGVELPDSSLCFPGASGMLIGMSAAGDQSWSLRVSSNPIGGLAVADDGSIYGLLPTEGALVSISASHEVRWRCDLKQPLATFIGTPLILEGGRVVLSPGLKGVSFVQGDGAPVATTPTPFSTVTPGANRSREVAGGRPPAVSNLVASDNASGSGVLLSWNSSPGARSYEVWRGVGDNPKESVLIASNISGRTNFYDLTLAAGVTNNYWVRAVNGSGIGDFSSPEAGSRKPGPDGVFRWSRSTGGGFPLSVTVGVNGGVGLLTTSGPFEIVDALGGTLVDSFSMPSDVIGGRFTFQCQTLDGRILLGVQEYPTEGTEPSLGRLICLDSHAKPLWSVRFGVPVALAPAVDTNGVAYLPLVRPGYYGPAVDQGLVAINPDGTERWRWASRWNPAASPTVAADGSIYLPCVDPALYQLSPRGELLRLRILPESVTDRVCPSASGFWWLRTVTGIRTLSSDFSTLRSVVQSPDPTVGEVFTGVDNGTTFAWGGGSYRANADGTKSGFFNASGVPYLASTSNFVTLGTTSGAIELTTLGAVKRTLSTPETRATPITVSPDGSAFFGTVEGVWYCAPVIAAAADTVWPQVGHDSRLSGTTTYPESAPGMVTNLFASSNKFGGTVVLKWSATPGAQSYSLYRRGPADPP